MHDYNWRNNKPELYTSVLRELEGFPFLAHDIEDDLLVLRGLWPVFGDSNLVDHYSIKVVIQKDFPSSVPHVFELGGDIPRTPERHVNHDGTCCLFSPPERWDKWPEGSGIAILLNGAIKEYFFSQSYYTRTGKWPFGEWAHGDLGVIEYYIDRLKVRSIAVLAALLKLHRYRKPSKQWLCPCKSGKTYKNCHWIFMKPLIGKLPENEWDYLKRLLASLEKKA